MNAYIHGRVFDGFPREADGGCVFAICESSESFNVGCTVLVCGRCNQSGSIFDARSVRARHEFNVPPNVHLAILFGFWLSTASD